MKKCAFLVTADPGDDVANYHLSLDAMAELGWQVDSVPWRSPNQDMELELIEPSLYLRTNDEAAGRFASAFTDFFERCRPDSRAAGVVRYRYASRCA